MLTVLNDPAAGRPDSIRFGPSAYGVERVEVYISTRGFDPHRHDTYGIRGTDIASSSQSAGNLAPPRRAVSLAF